MANDKKGPKEAGDGAEQEEKRPAFKPAQAIPPIVLMGAFIIITIGLSLIVGPLYDSYGLSSGFEEFADSDIWYLYAFGFLGVMIAVAVLILLLRKLLKRRKLKLKYIFAFVVFTSTLVVVQPLLDTAFNGAPPRWERYDLEIKGAESAYPLDPHDIGSGFIILTNSSFHVLQKGRYSMKEIDSVSDIDQVFDPYFKNGIWVISGIVGDDPLAWSLSTEGEVSQYANISGPEGDNEFIGAQIDSAQDVHFLVTFWANETYCTGIASHLDGTSGSREIDIVEPSDDHQFIGPFKLVQGWNFQDDNYLLSGNGSHHYDIHLVDDVGYIRGISSGSSGLMNTTWGVSQGDHTIHFTRAEHWGTGEASYDILSTPHFRFANKGHIIEWNGNPSPTTTFYSINEEGHYQMDLLDGKDYYLIEPDDERSVETVVDGGIGLFREPGGKIWIIEEEHIWRGEFTWEERGQMFIQILSFMIAGALVAALLLKPKWWLVDLGGMLMGAGVIAIMGISFPLPFTLLLLVLLAVYDFISVYKTKHMIALADSVVEAKMPILLVFPMKWSYRYEDETNLMDPKRKRESLFMGLGDVIIPGILILSAASFLSPVGGIKLFGFIYPPVAVALFALVGMLAGWLSLMIFVIRGKAHAGLPPINSGTILGFLIGMLVVYGTIVFW